MKPAWFPDWSGQKCLIVGSGESASREIVERFRGAARVVVINTSYHLAPWADALYAADEKWWSFYKEAAGFAGLKISCDKNKASSPEVRRLAIDMTRHEFMIDDVGTIGCAGFSGFQALNFVLYTGAKDVALAGFDFVGCHWHGKHPGNLQQTRDKTREKWRDRLDAQAERLKELGVSLVNLSAVSTLQNYPKMSVDEYLAGQAQVAA